jgi:predicted 3-demethylubiquinone-9 3-methyltransferase (glyoxalase superfamily)
MQFANKIVTCLWYDTQAEEAANFYCSIFKNSKVGEISRYSEVGKEYHGKEAGSVLTVNFELEGMPFTALNGGPIYKFTEAISLQVFCDDQVEVDHFWTKLAEGGDKSGQQCGWLKDKFGLSWQVVPKEFMEMLSDSKSGNPQKAMAAMFQMKKLDIAELRKAYKS